MYFRFCFHILELIGQSQRQRYVWCNSPDEAPGQSCCLRLQPFKAYNTKQAKGHAEKDFLSRAYEVASRYHETLSRAHEIIFFSACPFSDSVL